jgi:hypothetical protein
MSFQPLFIPPFVSLLGKVPDVSGPITLVNCTFTAADSTNLQSYPWTDSADVRPGVNQWIDYTPSGGFLVMGNMARSKSNGGLYINIINHGSIVGATFTSTITLGTATDGIGFTFRYASSSTRWVAFWVGGLLALREITGGSNVLRASVAKLSAIGTYSMSLVDTGNLMTFTVGDTVVSYSSTAKVTNSYAGIQVSNVTLLNFFDDFKVTVP